MIYWRREVGNANAGSIVGSAERGRLHHPFDQRGQLVRTDEFHGNGHGLLHYPAGTERIFAKNDQAAPTGFAYVGVFDQVPERGEMIAGRIREELVRPLAHRIEDFFRVRVVSRNATVSDVRSMRDQDVVVAVLGKGGEATAMLLFQATVEHFHARMDVAVVKGETQKKFSVLGGGVTVAKVAVVPVAAASPFGGDEALIGNTAVHEFGHAISTLGYDRDHRTGGVMKPVIGTDEPALHFTADFLKQF